MAKPKKKRKVGERAVEQVAALPFRLTEDGQLEVLVQTSRATHRAVLPKGWPMKNRKDWKAAQIEARQEAGVIGEPTRTPIGHYHYWKRLQDHFELSKVAVFPLAVRRQLTDWPERNQRVQLWLSPDDAALMVDETDLGDLIRAFATAMR